MNRNLKKRQLVRKKRALRIRKKLKGTAERPRLSVSKSLKHIGAQLIDDEKGITLGSFSTLSKEAKDQGKSKESARLIGQKIAEVAKQKKLSSVIFDRGRFKYHGLIAELAEAAREAGLKF